MLPLNRAFSHSALLRRVLHDGLSTSSAPVRNCMSHFQLSPPSCLTYIHRYLTLLSLIESQIFSSQGSGVINTGWSLVCMISTECPWFKVKIMRLPVLSTTKINLCQDKVSKDSSVTDCVEFQGKRLLVSFNNLTVTQTVFYQVIFLFAFLEFQNFAEYSIQNHI